MGPNPNTGARRLTLQGRTMVVGAAVLAALFLAGCVRPAVDGSAQGIAPVPRIAEVETPGPHDVLRLEYDFGPTPLVIRDSRGAPYPSRVMGSVHIPDGPGPFPFLLFMHGRHGTCAVAGFETLGPVVCPDTPATANVRSYTGYDYLARPLAAHGYVVASIDANNLNDLDLSMGDQGAVGRAQLVSKTLDEFARLNQTSGAAPVGDRLVGKLDYSRIGLMGHSRGGEGVTRFISWNQERTDGPRYPLKAVFALAPTDFARWKVTDVAFATLLPYCDGDVSNLQGAWMYDDARYLDEAKPSPKIQILALGSNHNFYNTVWTGDDGGRYDRDPHCGPTRPVTSEPGRRLLPDDQRRHGRAYMEAFFRTYVGDEEGFGTWFTGAHVPLSACPVGWDACEDYLHVSYHAPAPMRRVVEDTLDDRSLTTNDLGGASTFGPFVNKTVCRAPQCPPAAQNHGRANLLQLGWDQASYWTTTLPEDARDASRFDAFTFRAIADYSDPKNQGRSTQEVRIVLVDEDGRIASVLSSDQDNALFVPPGAAGARRAVPNEHRIPLAAFEGIDLARLARVEFRFDQTPTGSLLLTDVMFQAEAAAGASRRAALPS